MEKKRFTFFTCRMSILLLLAGGWLPAGAQCNPPLSLEVLSATQNTATLRFEPAQDPFVDHCWNLEVGGVGFTAGDGQALQTATICTSDPGLIILNGAVIFTISGLQPGTTYEWCVSETCDGLFPPNNVSGWACAPAFATFDKNFAAAPGVLTRPSCPTASPGFLPDGAFVVNINDGSSCPGTTYDIHITSGPYPVLPASYTGVPAGAYTFSNAGPGTYTVEVLETGSCNPEFNPVAFDLAIPEGVDDDSPHLYLTDILGNVLIDSDPASPTPADLDLGALPLPEGSCSFQQELFAFAVDNCDGLITAGDALALSAQTTPSTINPPTQASVFGDGLGTYRIDLNWSIGNTTLNVSGIDAAGNTTELTLTAFFDDNQAPGLTLDAPENITIPFCADEREVLVTIYVDLACDQYVDPNSLLVDFGESDAQLSFAGPDYFEYRVTVTTDDNGEIWSAAYFDDFGEMANTSIQLAVTPAVEDLPPVIIAADENALIPACEEDYLLRYSFQVLDDCADIIPADVIFDDGDLGLSMTFLSTDPNNNSAFFEVEGALPPGQYAPVISYEGVVMQPLITVTQQAGQAPAVDLPGDLNFTIPVCGAEVTGTFSVTVSDDCDDPLPEDPLFFLDGEEIIPSFINEANNGLTYYEFTPVLTTADDGALFLVLAIDGDGNETDTEALLTVTVQPDTWAPVIVYPSQDIEVVLDPCAPSTGTVFFEVTATDNCDGAVEPVVTAEPSQGVQEATILPSPGGDTYLLVAAPGSYQVIIEAVDAAGNTRTEDFFIAIDQAPVEPVNLACNDNALLSLNEACEAVLTPGIVLEGDFGCLTAEDFAVVVVDSDVSNGPVIDGPGQYNFEVSLAEPPVIEGFTGPFAPGNWLLSVSDPALFVTFNGDAELAFGNPADPAGTNTATAAITIPQDGLLSFDWEFFTNEFPGGATFELFGYVLEAGGVIDEFILASDGPVGTVGPDGTAAGSEAFDLSAGDVLILSLTVDGLAPFGAEASVSNWLFTPAGSPDAGNFQGCWGQVRAEDRTRPTISCPDDTDQAQVEAPVQFIEGALENTDAQLNTANYSCFLDAVNPPPGAHFYDLYTFTVTENDVYTFDVFTGWNDGALSLFQGDFEPGNPCQNVIAFSDDAFAAGQTPFDPLLRLALPLQAGQTYTLLVTSWPPDQTGNYSVAVYSDGAGQLSGYVVQNFDLTRELICTDFDKIFNVPESVDFVGAPTTGDNCTDPAPFTFTDTFEENGDCGDVVITRTFSVEDEAGRVATCQQEITVRKPALDDVTLPPFTVFLECDENFPVDDNGNPGPAIAGYPFLQTAFGARDIDQTICNLAAAYQDGNRIESCAGAYQLVRDWTVLDWCNPGSSIVFSQIIKVGDYTAPQVTCPSPEADTSALLTFFTGPFSCDAAFEAPLPTVTDNCGTWEVLTEIVTDSEVAVTDEYGEVVDTQIVTNVLVTLQPGMPRTVSQIPTGTHRFRYTVTDDCGNASITECDFRVVDNIEPVAECADLFNLSVSDDGLGRLFAVDLDEGSYDACGPVRLEIRRLISEDATCDDITPFFSDWSEQVEFSCCDVGEYITVELRVWDDANEDGVIGGPGDLSNTCSAEVFVEDKQVPVCIAPLPVVIDCDELPADFDPTDLTQLSDLFGEATWEDNCLAEWEELPPVNNVEDCGFGSLIRRFRAIDSYGNTSNNNCQQPITINEIHDYEIKFPRDAEANCGDPVVDTLEVSEAGCDLLAVNVEDEFFSASGDECYKIFRTYSIINWCEYDGESEPVIVSRDEDCDGNPGDEDIWVLVRPNGVTYFDRDNHENNNNPLPATKGVACDGLTNPAGHWLNSTFDAEATRDPITGEDDPDNQGETLPVDDIRDMASRGFWKYTQQIKVYDNIQPEITVEAFEAFSSGDNVDCDAPVSIAFAVEENCTPEDLTVKAVNLDAFWDGVNFFSDFHLGDGLFQLNGVYPDYTIDSEGLPIGSHAFEIHVADGCGNSDALIVPFEVIDTLAPAPLCIDGIAVELMPTEDDTDVDGDGDIDPGAVTIWATDFIPDSQIDDCSGPVTYSINREGEAPDSSQTGLVLTCDDLGTFFVEIHAWDGAGLHSFCMPYVLVQDNQFDLCISGAAIGGHIETEVANGLEDVEVNLNFNGDLSGMELTDEDGYYVFPSLEVGGDYTVRPFLNTNHFNGVSTFDLVLMSKHILGEEALSSLYQMIAADVNNSGTITTLDLIQARKGVLGIIDEFPSNTSWRFVDAAYVFPDPLDPWSAPFPEVINFNNLQTDQFDGDFVAIKVGDINGSAQFAGAPPADERSVAGTFTIDLSDVALLAGQEHTLTFQTAQLNGILGFQFTLGLSPEQLEVVDVEYGRMEARHLGMRFVDEGQITGSWHHASIDEKPDAGPATLFRLKVRAKRNVRISEALELNSRRTQAEAYNLAGERMAVNLAFDGNAARENVFRLYPNAPNPFRDQTTIAFTLPEPQPVTLRIRDMSGRTVFAAPLQGNAGFNQLSVSAENLPGGGLYYYTLETPQQHATRKLILLR